MRKLLLSVAFYLFVVGVASAQSKQPSQSPELLQSSELNSTVMKIYNEGKYDEALPLAKRALDLREKALGPGNQDLIPLLVNLAELYKAKRKPGDAQAYLERALQIGEKVFGAEDARITRFLDKLAFLTYEQRNEKSAETLFARSLAIKAKALCPDRPEVAETAFNLAEIYRLRSEFPRAEPLYQQAIRIREENKDKDNSELIR